MRTGSLVIKVQAALRDNITGIDRRKPLKIPGKYLLQSRFPLVYSAFRFQRHEYRFETGF